MILEGRFYRSATICIRSRTSTSRVCTSETADIVSSGRSDPGLFSIAERTRIRKCISPKRIVDAPYVGWFTYCSGSGPTPKVDRRSSRKGLPLSASLDSGCGQDYSDGIELLRSINGQISLNRSGQDHQLPNPSSFFKQRIFSSSSVCMASSFQTSSIGPLQALVRTSSLLANFSRRFI